MVMSPNAMMPTVVGRELGAYRVVYNAGRAQPFTIWRGAVVQYFCATEQQAIDYLATRRKAVSW